jgi:hypothetical protein
MGVEGVDDFGDRTPVEFQARVGVVEMDLAGGHGGEVGGKSEG